MAIREQSNPTIRGIIVLLVIAVVCVALLAVLNDLLYVPPDTSSFNKAAEGTYNADIAIDESAPVTAGKIVVVAEGTLANEAQSSVVGLYIVANKVGKAGEFTIVIIIDRSNDTIVGALEVVDGSTGGYTYDETLLSGLVGTQIPSDNAFDLSSIVQTGATRSSETVLNAFIAAAEYYNHVYAGGETNED